MLTVNTDIQDHLINGPLGKVTQIVGAKNIIRKVYVKFFYTKAGLKIIVASYFSRHHSWVGIEKSESKILSTRVQHLYQLRELNFH